MKMLDKHFENVGKVNDNEICIPEYPISITPSWQIGVTFNKIKIRKLFFTNEFKKQLSE